MAVSCYVAECGSATPHATAMWGVAVLFAAVILGAHAAATEFAVSLVPPSLLALVAGHTHKKLQNSQRASVSKAALGCRSIEGD